MSEQDRTAPPRKSAAELRAGLKHASESIQDWRRKSADSRDKYEKFSVNWLVYDAEVRAYALALHTLYCNTLGEFGEEYKP